MRKGMLLLAAAVLAAGFAPAPFPRPGRKKNDLERMQGTWLLRTMLINGKPSGRNTGQVVIASDRLKYVKDGKVTVEYMLTLDSSKKPGWYVARRVGAPTTFQGLYFVDRDTLKFGYNGGGRPRPAALEGDGGGVFLEVYRRIGP